MQEYRSGSGLRFVVDEGSSTVQKFGLRYGWGSIYLLNFQVAGYMTLLQCDFQFPRTLHLYETAGVRHNDKQGSPQTHLYPGHSDLFGFFTLQKRERQLHKNIK